jgi:uncharacterized protein YhaN
LPTLETLESDLENYEQSLEKTKREIRTTQELLESLEREIRKVEPELPAQIEASANKMIENYFGHEFGAVYYQEPEWRVRVKPNQERSLHSLSRGQADLLRLIIRIASLEMLDSVENDFVVWDDVLGNLDDARLRNMRNLIDAFAGKRQVILFSRDNRLAQKSEAILLRPEGDFKSTY